MATDLDERPAPRLVSALPGRRRYVWPLLQDSEAACAALAEWLGKWPGMRDARTYSLTGSLVITFDPLRLDLNALERALETWQSPVAATPSMAPGHRSHDLWVAALLGNVLFQHLVLQRGRPVRGERLAHLAVALSAVGLLPAAGGGSQGRDSSRHALELLIGAFSLLTGEHRRTGALLWLLHLPEMAEFLRSLGRRQASPPSAV